ncbi:MAG: ExbD/TolR family protein [Phycisphaerales bacterium JB058]|jgi:biopolymer transport protein ExbD
MKREGHVEDGFDMTPMIDVVMLLIIFFLVTSQFSQSIRTQLELPKQQGQETEVDTSGDIVVDLLADGSIRLEGESISMDSFIAMVSAELLHGNAETQVLIRPERTGQALHLNRLCARLSQAGVRAYRIATNPVDGGEG